MNSKHLAFDSGGANLKVSDGEGYSSSRKFALWKHSQGLGIQLRDMIAAAPECNSLVATMTGELADCFASKRVGVHSIIDALCASAQQRSVSIYLTDGTFVTPDEAREQHQLAAASNWHALAQYAAGITENENALLVDIGSTTCDVIPIVDGNVAAQGQTDTQRLIAQELIYAGIERTPICALTQFLPYRDRECPIARELFATTLDVHLVTGDIAERSGDLDTADGQPATRKNALIRLARCVCADELEFNVEDGESLAAYVSWELGELVQDAITAVSAQSRLDDRTPIVLSGHGDFLLRRFVSDSQPIISLAKAIGPEAARCAPAYALAKLADHVFS